MLEKLKDSQLSSWLLIKLFIRQEQLPTNSALLQHECNHIARLIFSRAQENELVVAPQVVAIVCVAGANCLFPQ